MKPGKNILKNAHYARSFSACIIHEAMGRSDSVGQEVKDVRNTLTMHSVDRRNNGLRS